MRDKTLDNFWHVLMRDKTLDTFWPALRRVGRLGDKDAQQGPERIRCTHATFGDPTRSATEGPRRNKFNTDRISGQDRRGTIACVTFGVP